MTNIKYNRSAIKDKNIKLFDKFNHSNILYIVNLPHPYNKIGDGPEGPEVRTVSDKLRPYLIGKIITNISKGERAKTLGFDNIKCPVKIIGVRSYGKKILIDVDTEHMIIISLGMSGRLQYTQGNHSHIRFDIAESNISGPFNIIKYIFSLYFDDPRYMGNIDIIPNSGISLYFRDIGPDLLQLALIEETWIPLDIWLAIFGQKKLKNRIVCDVLIDQSLIAGIGNYLRCEILYYAAIDPKRKVESLTTEEWDRIRISSHKVIYLSYTYGGFTIQSFISPDGQVGTYPAVVYGKTHDPIGNVIIKTKIKDRTMHWVPAIQK